MLAGNVLPADETEAEKLPYPWTRPIKEIGSPNKPLNVKRSSLKNYLPRLKALKTWSGKFYQVYLCHHHPRTAGRCSIGISPPAQASKAGPRAMSRADLNHAWHLDDRSRRLLRRLRKLNPPRPRGSLPPAASGRKGELQSAR